MDKIALLANHNSNFIVFGKGMNQNMNQMHKYYYRAMLSFKSFRFNYLVHCDKWLTRALHVCDDQLFISTYLHIQLILFIFITLSYLPSNNLSVHHFDFLNFVKIKKDVVNHY